MAKRVVGIPSPEGRALLAVAKMIAFDPFNLRELHNAVRGLPPPERQRNPAMLHADVEDPRLRAVSQRFHGTPDEVAILEPDQRQPPPEKVVVIGEEKAVVYQPDGHSRRGGIEWEHSAGDRGQGHRKLRGRRLLVADADGNVYTVPGSSRMEFDPDRGLVG